MTQVHLTPVCGFELYSRWVPPADDPEFGSIPQCLAFPGKIHR